MGECRVPGAEVDGRHPGQCELGDRRPCLLGGDRQLARRDELLDERVVDRDGARRRVAVDGQRALLAVAQLVQAGLRLRCAARR
jgi:hypothetical protein